MQAADELALHITQGSIAMVSLPVLVAGLQEVACLLEGNMNHMDSSYTAWQILPLKLSQRLQTHLTKIQSGSRRFKLHIMSIFWYLNDFCSHNLDTALHLTRSAI